MYTVAEGKRERKKERKKRERERERERERKRLPTLFIPSCSMVTSDSVMSAQ